MVSLGSSRDHVKDSADSRSDSRLGRNTSTDGERQLAGIACHAGYLVPNDQDASGGSRFRAWVRLKSQRSSSSTHGKTHLCWRSKRSCLQVEQAQAEFGISTSSSGVESMVSPLQLTPLASADPALSTLFDSAQDSEIKLMCRRGVLPKLVDRLSQQQPTARFLAYLGNGIVRLSDARLPNNATLETSCRMICWKIGRSRDWLTIIRR